MTPENASTQAPAARSRMKNLRSTFRLLLYSYGRLLPLILALFSPSQETPSKSPFKHSLIILIWVPFFVLTQTVHWLCLLLDELLFPAYHQVSVREPVFVVGVPRSGTTLLHRSLALDTDRFISMKAWEILFAPSILEKKFFAVLGKLDRALGHVGYKMLVRMEKKSGARFNDIHPSGPFEHEEDELLFAPTFSTLALYYPFPNSRELLRFARFDEEIGETDREQLMSFYRACIQRHLYIHGAEKTYLSKNPLATCKIAALKDAFPDAKFICCVRDPADAVPSAMSLSLFFWKQYANDPENAEFLAKILDIMHYFYVYPMRIARSMPHDAWAVVKYEQLKCSVEAAIVDLYPRLNLELGDEFRDRLRSNDSTARSFTSKHAYSADQYGLGPQQIQSKFGDVCDHYEYSIKQYGEV